MIFSIWIFNSIGRLSKFWILFESMSCFLECFEQDEKGWLKYVHFLSSDDFRYYDEFVVTVKITLQRY